MIKRYTRPQMGQIWSEENKYRSWLQVEIAACEAWNKLGKIPSKDLQTIKKKANFSLDRIEEIEAEVQHDLIAFLTSVSEYVGPSSRFIHLGMTSYDVEDTALAIRLRDSVDLLIPGAIALRDAVLTQARRHQDTLMMGRTHGVHAEPTTFGLKLLVWVDELNRAIVRLENTRATVAVGKISGAVGTYAHLDPRVEQMACKSLGLTPAPASTQIVQRDRHAEYLATLAILAGTIDNAAMEIRHLQKTECGEAEEPFRKGQKGSSAMPHKKNPMTCERLCGMARLIRGYALAAMEDQALWHERDISHSSVERVILPDASILVDYMLATFTRVISDLVVHADRMQENIDRGLGLFFSESLLLALVNAGLTRETAYRMVQECAMAARDQRRQMRNVVEEHAPTMAALSPKDLDKIFDINKFVAKAPVVFKRFASVSKGSAPRRRQS